MTDDELRRLGRARFDNVGLIWDYDSVAALERRERPFALGARRRGSGSADRNDAGALPELKNAGQPIDLYLFPDTDHGMMEFATNADGSRR